MNYSMNYSMNYFMSMLVKKYLAPITLTTRQP